MANERSSVKRVQPYPFPLSIQKDGKVVSAQVLKLSQRGAILEVGSVVFKVGEEFQVVFTLPVHKVDIVTFVKVVKTYDRASSTGQVERLIEVHFSKLSGDQAKAVYRFLLAIKQVSR